MSIGLYTNQLLQPVPGGIGRYIISLLSENNKTDLIDYITISSEFDLSASYCPRHIDWPSNKLINKIFVKFPGIKYELFFSFLRKIYSPSYNKAIQLMHAPSLAIPIVDNNVPLITTIHDIAFLKYPQAFTKRGVSFHKRGLKIALEESKRVITPSEFVANELIEIGYPSKKIDVIHHGAALLSTTNRTDKNSFILNKLNLEKDNYALTVSTLEPRKNISLLINIFNKVGKKLVIVGPKGWGDNNFNQNENIILAGKVDDNDLIQLYKNAKIFCSASKYEGFGMPALEAMTLGCIPLVSNIESHKELIANENLLANDQNDWETKVKLLFSDDKMIKEMEEYCKERVKEFTWKKSLSLHNESYKKIL